MCYDFGSRYQEYSPMRVEAIYVLNSSILFDPVLSLAKKVFKKEVQERVSICILFEKLGFPTQKPTLRSRAKLFFNFSTKEIMRQWCILRKLFGGGSSIV